MVLGLRRQLFVYTVQVQPLHTPGTLVQCFSSFGAVNLAQAASPSPAILFNCTLRVIMTVGFGNMASGRHQP
jgi:hypothetical protein